MILMSLTSNNDCDHFSLDYGILKYNWKEKALALESVVDDIMTRNIGS